MTSSFETIPQKLIRPSTTILVSNYPQNSDIQSLSSHLRSLVSDASISFQNPAFIPEIASLSIDVMNPPSSHAIRRWNGSQFRGSPLWVIQDVTTTLPLKDRLLSVISSSFSSGVMDLSSFQSRLPMRVDLNKLSFSEFLLFLVGCFARESKSEISTLDLSHNKLNEKAFVHFEKFLLFLPDLTTIILTENEFSSFPGFKSRPGLAFLFEASEPRIPEPDGWNDPPSGSTYVRVPGKNEPPDWNTPYVFPMEFKAEIATEMEQPDVVSYGPVYGGIERKGGPLGWFNGTQKVNSRKGSNVRPTGGW
jgi:hypothetical protein